MTELKELESPDDLKNVDDLPVEVVPVPEWNCSVRVRGMTGVERDAWEATLAKERADGKREINHENLRARLLVRCIVRKDGRRVYTDSQTEDLGNRSGAVLARLFEVASRLSGLGKKDVEELAGKSGAAQTSTSSTG